MTGHTTAGRIVVGVDGSPGSRAALAWASRQAELTGATVSAWHVLRHPASLEWTVLPTNYGGAPMPIVFDRDEVLASAARSLAELVAAVGGSQVITTHVVEGNPTTELVTAAKGADLLVLGRHGRGGFAGALMGSVSRHCVEHAPCPVVIIPPDPPSTGHQLG